jgi:hypothetical protein
LVAIALGAVGTVAFWILGWHSLQSLGLMWSGAVLVGVGVAKATGR